MQPHSQTVRGTLSHPKLDLSAKPPQLGDHISLEREKNDSAPLFTRARRSTLEYNIAPGDPYRQGTSPPYSQRRGSMGNMPANWVNKSMLGDAVSFKAETSQNGFWMGAGGKGVDVEGMRWAAEERVRAQSKL